MKVLIFSLLFAFVAFIQSQEPTPVVDTTDVEVDGSGGKTHFTHLFFGFWFCCFNKLRFSVFNLTCFNGTGTNVSEVECYFGETVTNLFLLALLLIKKKEIKTS